MDKVLVSELLYSQGHKRLNGNYVNCISDMYNVVLIDDGKYYENTELSNKITRVKFHPIIVKRVEILKTLCNAINMVRIARIAKKERIKNVVLLSFHVKGFSLIRRCFKDINLCVVHHYEIDRMAANKKEIQAFDKFKNEITHCVLEDFIKAGLVDRFGVESNRVFVVNTLVDMVHNDSSNSESNLFLGIGQSTDQALVDDCIAYDENNASHIEEGGRIILRSKGKAYSGKCLEVITGFLSKEKYDELYNQSSACIVKYESTYDLRSSGSIDDAFRNRKKVIVFGFPAGDSYAQMFPHNIMKVNNVDELFDLLSKTIEPYDSDEGEKFEREHSRINVSKQWQRAISRE